MPASSFFYDNLRYFLLAWLAVEVVFYISGFFYLRALGQAFKLRRPDASVPWNLWLELVPVFGLFWQFWNVMVAGDLFPEEDADRHKRDQTCPHAHLLLAAGARAVTEPLVFLTYALLPYFIWIFESDESTGRDPLAIIAILLPICFFYAVWQRGRYSRHVGRLSRGEPADGRSLAAVDRREPPRCSCLAEIECSPDRVFEACMDLARDLRWHPVKRAGNPLTFRVYGRGNPAGWLYYRRITIRANAKPARRGTAVRFVVDVNAFWFSSFWLPEARRATVAFAQRVCSDLAARGFSVHPAELAAPRHSRKLLVSITEWRWLAEIGLASLTVMGIAALIVVDVVGQVSNWMYVVPFAGICLLFITDYLRHWATGLRAPVKLGFAILIQVPWVLVLLVILFPGSE